MNLAGLLLANAAALAGEWRLVVLDSSTGLPATAAELFVLAAEPPESVTASPSAARAWCGAHGRSITPGDRGFATLDPLDDRGWIAAFDGPRFAIEQLQLDRDELSVVRLPDPSPRSTRSSAHRALDIDVVDAAGTPQRRVGIRLLYFNGCGTCGWGTVATAESDSRGRATIEGALDWFGDRRGMGGSRGSWAVVPDFAHATECSLSIDPDAPHTAPLRLVVPQRVAAELFVAAPPHLPRLPPFELWFNAGDSLWDDGLPKWPPFLRRALVAGVPLRIELEPGERYVASLWNGDLCYSSGEIRFAPAEGPAPRRIELPIAFDDLLYRRIVALDDQGAPIAGRLLSWKIVAGSDALDPCRFNDGSLRFLGEPFRSGADGGLDCFLQLPLDTGEPPSRFRVVEIERSFSGDFDFGPRCLRRGEVPLSAVLATADAPTTVVLATPPLLAAGRVVDPQGRPIGGARVTLYPVDHEKDLRRMESRSDAAGRFAFHGSGAERDFVYLALDRLDGELLAPTHDRVMEQPGPEPLVAIRCGESDAVVEAIPVAIDLVLLQFDADVDPSTILIDVIGGGSVRGQEGAIALRGSPGPYELVATFLEPADGVIPRLPIRATRLRRDARDARLEPFDLRR